MSYEVGAKGTLLDETLGYGATLFWMDVDDLQVQTIVGTRILVSNAASARSRGLEYDLRWLTPWQPLRFDASGAFTDARFVDFPDGPAPAGSASMRQDLSGKRMPFVPDVQLHASPSLTFAGADLPLVGEMLPDDFLLTGAVGVLYRSDTYLRVDLGPHTRQSDYVIVDGRVGASFWGESLWLGVTVDNVTDAEVREFVTESVAFPGGFGVIQETQRTWAFAMKYAW